MDVDVEIRVATVDAPKSASTILCGPANPIKMISVHSVCTVRCLVRWAPENSSMKEAALPPCLSFMGVIRQDSEAEVHT